MTKKTGNDLFIVDNGDEDWKVLNYLNEWSDISSRFDIATAHSAGVWPQTLEIIDLDAPLQRKQGRSQAEFVVFNKETR